MTDNEIKKILSTVVIICDTREKKNKHITDFFDAREIAWESKKLDYGDYSIYIPANEELGISEDIYFNSEVMVEKKNSLEEISGNITKDSGRRIRKEFANAPSDKVLLIENNTYEDLVTGNYDTQLNPKAFWANLLSMWHRYNIPVVFMPDNKYTGQFIYGFLYYFVRNWLKYGEGQKLKLEK